MQSTPLARKNLTDRPTRTVVSATGIGFAIVLMFMQLGFMGAVGDTATNVYRRALGDLVIRSPEYLQTFNPRSLPTQATAVVASMAEVAEVRTLDLGITSWRDRTTGEQRAVAIMGVEPSRPALQIHALGALGSLLHRPEHVLVDNDTRADFGPVNGVEFGAGDIGQETEVTGRRVVIAGTFEMGTGLAANGALLVSHDGFNRLAPDRMPAIRHNRQVSMVLVKLRSHMTRESGKLAIQDRLARLDGPLAAAEVLTIDEAMHQERMFWYLRTPVGAIFGVGVVLAMIVGGVICYMVLAADVIARLPEYATLKAIGYPNAYLIKVLLGQSAWLAGVAFPPAIIASLTLYQVTSFYSGVLIRMTGERLLLVAALSVVMCAAAAWVALRKMIRAEPANLF